MSPFPFLFYHPRLTQTSFSFHTQELLTRCSSLPQRQRLLFFQIATIFSQSAAVNKLHFTASFAATRPIKFVNRRVAEISRNSLDKGKDTGPSPPAPVSCLALLGCLRVGLGQQQGEAAARAKVSRLEGIGLLKLQKASWEENQSQSTGKPGSLGQGVNSVLGEIGRGI